MSLSREYTEYHLTENPWVQGTTCIDIQGERFVSNPPDRVQTVRWVEEQTSTFSKPYRDHELIWESADKELVKKLREKFGDPPKRL